jgi:protoporphyrinogen oxidase
VKGAFAKKKSDGDISQKGTETSLIEKFMYPKLGPGQLWEYVAEDVKARGGVVRTGCNVVRLLTEGSRVVAAEMEDEKTGARETIAADYFFSTMPIKELMRALDARAGQRSRSERRTHLPRFHHRGAAADETEDQRADTRRRAAAFRQLDLHVQEPDVQVGRMQIFNNWSPYLVATPTPSGSASNTSATIPIPIWRLPDADMIDLAKREMAKIGIIETGDVLDACVIRVPKTYPAYFGAYERFEEIKTYVNGWKTCFS